MTWFVDMAGQVLGVLFFQVFFSTVVCLVVLLLSRLLRSSRPSLHLGLWTLVFLRLLLPPDLSHPLSAGALGSLVIGQSRWASALEQQSDLVLAGEQKPTDTAFPLQEHIDPLVQPWPTIVFCFWLVGVVVFGGLHTRRLIFYHRVLNDARPVIDERVLAAAESWRRRLGINRAVRVVSCELVVSPFTARILKPTIFVPAAVMAKPRLVEAVLAHEMVHVARWDSLWLHIQHLLQIIYFFHPVVWIAGSRLAHERERACDATVLRHGVVQPRDYGLRLMDLVALDLRAVEAPTMRPVQRRMKMRLQSIINSRQLSQGKIPVIVTSALIGLVLLPLAGPPQAATGAEEQATLRAQALVRADQPLRSVPSGDDTAVVHLVNPLPGSRVSARYGDWINPFTHKEAFHRGIDLAAREGTPVHAPAGGLVEVATAHYDTEPASGTVVIIDHGRGVKTFYAHLGTLEVEAGQSVKSENVLATVGSTGRSTGPHLHFEVRRNGQTVDPAEYVGDWK